MAQQRFRSLQDLVSYERAMDLTIRCYELCEQFPEHERGNLALQVRRAATKVPAKLANGCGRGGRGFPRFVLVSLGALAATETHLRIASTIGYLTPEQSADVFGCVAEVRCQLNLLYDSLTGTTAGD